MALHKEGTNLVSLDDIVEVLSRLYPTKHTYLNCIKGGTVPFDPEMFKDKTTGHEAECDRWVSLLVEKLAKPHREHIPASVDFALPPPTKPAQEVDTAVPTPTPTPSASQQAAEPDPSAATSTSAPHGDQRP